MNLLKRIDLLETLGKYLTDNNEQVQAIKQKAFEKNKWFTDEFINLSFKNIATRFLSKNKLEDWVTHYHLDDNIEPKNIGIVMAGNIPLVGFHDFLCAFVSGHKQTIKLSEKDNILMKHIADKLSEWDGEVERSIRFATLLKNCDAYIATGSNNSSRYFKYYFGKYPSVIRGNKTSVAVLSGSDA